MYLVAFDSETVPLRERRRKSEEKNTTRTFSLATVAKRRKWPVRLQDRFEGDCSTIGGNTKSSAEWQVPIADRKGDWQKR